MQFSPQICNETNCTIDAHVELVDNWYNQEVMYSSPDVIKNGRVEGSSEGGKEDRRKEQVKKEVD